MPHLETKQNVMSDHGILTRRLMFHISINEYVTMLFIVVGENLVRTSKYEMRVASVVSIVLSLLDSSLYPRET